VAVVEAFGPGHRRGSSHGSARIFRRAYPDPLYVRMTGEAQRRWRQLSDFAAQDLILTTGAWTSARPRAGEDVRHLDRVRVPAELIPAASAAERWPGMWFGPDPVMFHPDGGVLDPERAMAAMRSIATARASSSMTAPGCCGWSRARRARACVRTTGPGMRGRDRGGRAWLEPLLGAHVRLPSLVVTQQDAFHFAPPSRGRGLPLFITMRSPGMACPPAGRPGAVKVGEHART